MSPQDTTNIASPCEPSVESSCAVEPSQDISTPFDDTDATALQQTSAPLSSSTLEKPDLLPSSALQDDADELNNEQEVQTVELSSSELFFNREINWLEFNNKVLLEAFEPKAPLLEQVKFLSIFYNNLDEFFMVRVSGTLHRYIRQFSANTPDKLSPARQLAQIRSKTLQMLGAAQGHWRKKLLPALKEKGVNITRYVDLNKKQQKFLANYFTEEIYPILTPQAIDPSHPLPVISNLSINAIIQLQSKQGIIRYARLKCPNNVSRFVFVPRSQKETDPYDGLDFSSTSRNNDIVLLEDIIQNHLHLLFPGYTVLATGLFRITRNTDFEIEEDETDDLLETIRELVEQRRFGAVVRLEISGDTPRELRDFLTQRLLIKPFQVYRIRGPLAMSEMLALYKLDRPSLKVEPYTPHVPEAFCTDNASRLFSHIRKKDVLLFHPYDSFLPVQEFIYRASVDPDVIAIKQTLYRAGNDSPIVKALIEARRLGKQVTVVVELKARFDEEQNITWAEEMEKAGIHVVYGMPGMKIHAKLCFIIRREGNGVKRYAHIGTGNYNASTAKIYTDFGLITAHHGICTEVSELFNIMTGYAEKDDYQYLLVSPNSMRIKLLQGIENEILHHQKYGNGEILFKCNQLSDKLCIQALYRASMEGVKIRLQVRGVCCLRPGILGISDNIEVTSLVGRFLEHTRIYAFSNNGDPLVYIGSADLMPRNLDRRIEVLVPLLNEQLRRHLFNKILIPHLNDTAKAYKLLEDGSYVRNQAVKGETPFHVQKHMMKRYHSDK